MSNPVDSVHSTPPTNTSVLQNGEPAGSLSSGLIAQQRAREAAFQRLRSLRKEARQEIDRLLNFLDASDLDPDLEETGDLEQGADAEPSLGSFDRSVNQEKAWKQSLEHPAETDAELDDCDKEDDDPAEDSEPSGIADYEGLLEQCPSIHARSERVE